MKARHSLRRAGEANIGLDQMIETFHQQGADPSDVNRVFRRGLYSEVRNQVPGGHKPETEKEQIHRMRTYLNHNGASMAVRLQHTAPPTIVFSSQNVRKSNLGVSKWVTTHASPVEEVARKKAIPDQFDENNEGIGV